MLPGLLSLGSLTMVLALAVIYFLLPQVPDPQSLRGVEFQVPLTIYARDGSLIGEFGEQKRIPVSLAETPPLLRDAIVAAEDDRFYAHMGVDWLGLVRAAVELVRTGEKRQGGSTITMQVARNFFLGREKTYLRKLTEILLAVKIEKQLTKDEILELYINKVFLGQRAYGFGAAAQVYYGRPLQQLGLAEVAMLAGLPKAPSRYNPVSDPVHAVQRRGYVLGRMLHDGKIDSTSYQQAMAAPVSAKIHARGFSTDAAYAAEMARAWAVSRYGAAAYTRGLKIETSLDPNLQIAANQAVRRHLIGYERRHQYRGPEQKLSVTDGKLESARTILADLPMVGGLMPALVLSSGEQVVAMLKDGEEVTLEAESVKWASAYWRSEAPGARDGFAPGDVIRVVKGEESGWQLTQVPEVQGALVSIGATDGSIRAITGGFDFAQSHFNRVTQADRQPGSNFKPFLYAAALTHGFTPATLVNDAPLVFNDDTRSGGWRPQNYSGKFFGPTRLRVALTKSRNLVSVRLLQSIGINRAREFCLRFGFPAEKLPDNLSLALGSGAMTPLELVGGYAVLANGGFRVEPHLVTRVLNQQDEVVWSSPFPQVPELAINEPDLAGEQPLVEETFSVSALAVDASEQGDAADQLEDFADMVPVPATQVLPDAEVFLINSMLRDVITKGTGRRAMRLGRNDLAGKTGTTNNQVDAWFSGYAAGVVTTAWVGYDRPRSLGKYETGARAALPIWIDYMEEALAGLEEQPLKQPVDVVSARIRPDTGQLAEEQDGRAIFEYFSTRDFAKLVKKSPVSEDTEPERADIF